MAIKNSKLIYFRKKWIIAIAILVIILLLALITIRLTNIKAPTQYNLSETEGWKTYNGEVYSFSYPSEFKIIIDQGDNITLENKNKDYIDISSVNYNEDLDGQPFNFDTFSFTHASYLCAADGPTGSNYCDKTLDKKEISTKTGNLGFKLLLNLVSESYSNGVNKITQSSFGPVYVIKGKIPKKVYIISTNYSNDPSDKNEFNQTLNKIISSLSIK